MVRQQLEREFGVDLKPKKKFINDLLVQLIEEKHAGLTLVSFVRALPLRMQILPKRHPNGLPQSENVRQAPPRRRNQRRVFFSLSWIVFIWFVQTKEELTQEEADRRLAEALQAELSGRPRRKAAREAIAASTKKAKGREARERRLQEARAAGKTAKPVWLSEALQAFLGVEECSRGEVSKKVWAYIKEHNVRLVFFSVPSHNLPQLQNPADRRQILCDEKLQALLGRPSTDMFGINKILAKHMKRHSEMA